MLPYPHMTSDNVEQARYDATVKALEFELDQFWKRSIFFWGFIAVAFGAFAATADNHTELRSPIASFGFVCSVIWTLANRGSKFWYENWEEKRKDAEEPITRSLYGVNPQEKCPKGKEKRRRFSWWLRARRFSPSKLTIALSDYTAILWLCLLFSTVPAIQDSRLAKCPNLIPVAFIVFSVVYVAFVLYCTNSSKDSKTEQPPSPSPTRSPTA